MPLDHYDQLNDTYVLGDPLPPEEYNSLVRVLDSQVVGALEGIGAGIIEGGEVIAPGGLAANMAAVKAVIETDKGLVYVEANEIDLTGLPNGATLYFWLCALLPESSDYDSRETGTLRLVYTIGSNQPPNSLALAHGATVAGQLVIAADDRVYAPARAGANLADRTANLETAVGIPYTGVSSLDSRVTDLEDGVTPGGGYEYWRNMPKAPADETTVTQEAQAIADAEVAEHVVQYHSGTGDSEIEPAELWDIDGENQARALLTAGQWLPDLPSEQRDCVIVIAGVYGDGSGGTPDFIDRVHSTWVP